MLNGYAAYSGVTLKASYTTGGGGGGDPVLGNNVPVTGLGASTNTWKYYQVTPGAGHTLTVTTSGTGSDADLYIRVGGQHPTTATYTCRSISGTNNESCTITNTTSAVYSVGVLAYRTYSGVTLKATY